MFRASRCILRQGVFCCKNIRTYSKLCSKSVLKPSNYTKNASILFDNTAPSITSSFRLTHTQGDKDLVEFLKDEIKVEKDSMKAGGKLPKLKGFELTSAEGANIVLTKKSDNETVTIKLNVNHSVDESLSEDQEEKPEEKEPEMVCKPAFIVEISKGGDKTLAIQCNFPPDEDMAPPGQENQFEEVIEIQDVALLEKGKEWSDDDYCLSGNIMDGNLYDMLLKLLEERGIDGELVDQLIEFSTTYEHNKYIGLLEQLQSFASSK